MQNGMANEVVAKAVGPAAKSWHLDEWTMETF